MFFCLISLHYVNGINKVMMMMMKKLQDVLTDVIRVKAVLYIKNKQRDNTTAFGSVYTAGSYKDGGSPLHVCIACGR